MAPVSSPAGLEREPRPLMAPLRASSTWTTQMPWYPSKASQRVSCEVIFQNEGWKRNPGGVQDEFEPLEEAVVVEGLIMDGFEPPVSAEDGLEHNEPLIDVSEDRIGDEAAW